MDDILVQFKSIAIFLSLHWSQNSIIQAEINLKIITVRNAASRGRICLVSKCF